MKKRILVFLWISALVFSLSSCNIWVCNNIDTEYLYIVEEDGKTYIKSMYANVYSIDFESKTYALDDDGETSFSWFEENDPKAFKVWFHQGGEYIYTIPAGFEGVVPHGEGCELKNDRSVVDACGYVKDGLLIGFVQVYKDMRTIYANYSIEEIDHSLLFTYDAESDEFTVTHKLDGAVVVAVHEDTVIYWKDRAYYKYDFESQTENYLIEDKAYDSGLTQYSSSGVYFNEEICILHMRKGLSHKDIDYLYVYHWSSDDFFELTRE